MSVVLPAPFSPTRPNTDPAGTVRSMPSSATLSPNRRDSPSISTTVGNNSTRLAIMVSSLPMLRLQDLVTLEDQLHDLLDPDVHLAGLGDQRVDPLRQDPPPLAAGQRRAGPG